MHLLQQEGVPARYKLQRMQTARAEQPSEPVAATAEDEQPSELVAYVQAASGKMITLNGTFLKITALNHKNCKLNALLDTGNSVSFVRPSIYDKFLLACFGAAKKSLFFI